MKRSIVFCVWGALALPCAAGELVSFRYYRDVDRGEHKGDEIHVLTLDSEIYFATRHGFPDLRLLDGRGVAVPYLLEKMTESRTHTVRRSCKSRVVSLQESDDNSVQIRIRLDDSALAADGLTVFTPLRDHHRRVHVSGSRDGQNWEPLVKDGVLFDYSRYMDVSNREIRLPRNDHRQLKIVIADVTDETESPYKQLTRKLRDQREQERTETTTVQRRPFRIDRIDLWSDTTRKQVRGDRRTEYPVVGFQVEGQPQQKRSVIHLRTRREPLTRFTVETSSRNFSRRLAVQVPVRRGTETQWSEVGQTTVSVVAVGDFRRQQLGVTFDEQRQEDYRLIIDNQDNPPLEITGVKAQGSVYRLVFFAQEGGTYRVYYGSESAEQPSYDMATVLAPVRDTHPTAPVRLGTEVPNPDYGTPSTAPRRGFLQSKVFLSVAICLTVAVLAWLLLRAGRQIEEMPQE